MLQLGLLQLSVNIWKLVANVDGSLSCSKKILQVVSLSNGFIVKMSAPNLNDMQSLFQVRGKSRLGKNKSLGNGYTIKGQVQTNHERYRTKVRGLAVFFFLSPKFVT